MSATAAREQVARKLLGHDVFVSYSRADGAAYAEHLASELTKLGLSCRLDQWGTKPGREVPPEMLRDLRRGSMLFIVGSAGAGTSAAVDREVQEFLPTGRPIIPIDVDGSLRSARWWPSLEGLAVAREAAPDGKPSKATIDRILNSISFTRRNARLARYSMAALVVFGVLALLATVAGQRAATAFRRADDASQRAETATQQAGAAEAARKSAEGRQKNAEERAGAAAKEAEAQLELANVARRERELAEAQLTHKVQELAVTTALADSRRYKQTLPIVERYLAEGRLDLACQRLDQTPAAPRNWEWGYYRAFCERDLLTLANRDEKVEVPGQAAYFAFSQDGTLGLWSSATGQPVETLGVLRSCSVSLPNIPHFQDVASSSDGGWGARGLGSGAIELFEKGAGGRRVTIQAHREPVAEVHFSPDGQLLVSRCGFAQLPPDKSVPDDHSVRVWEVPTGKAVAVLEEGTGSIDFALFSPDSRRVLIATSDEVARLWDPRTGGLVARLSGHTLDLDEATFGADGSLILTAAGWKCPAKVWANQADQVVSAVPTDYDDEHHFDVHPVRFPGKSVEIEKSTLRLLDYDLPRPYLFKEFKGHAGDIAHARFLNQRRTLLTVSLDHTARVWDVASGAFHSIPVGGDGNKGLPDGHTREIFSAVLLDAHRLLTASEDGLLKVWDVQTGRCLVTIDWIGPERRKPRGKRFYQTDVYRLSRDRRFVAIRPTWDATEPIRIWSLKTGELVNVLRAPGRELDSAHFSPDSSRLVTVTSSIMEQGYQTKQFWTALVWDVQDGEIIATLTLDGAKYAGRGGIAPLVDGSLRLDRERAAEIKGALSSGEFSDADFDADGQSVFALIDGERGVSYRIWTWSGLPPRFWKLAPADFEREVRDWKIERLLKTLGRPSPRREG